MARGARMPLYVTAEVAAPVARQTLSAVARPPPATVPPPARRPPPTTPMTPVYFSTSFMPAPRRLHHHYVAFWRRGSFMQRAARYGVFRFMER